MFRSLGAIDTVSTAGNRLQITGWAVAIDAGPVDGFKVTCTGRELSELRVTNGLPSPEIQAAHPHLPGAGQCRFRIEAALADGEAERVAHTVVTCAPLANGDHGRVLLHLEKPVLPMPSEADVQYVGGGFLTIATEFMGYFLTYGGLRPDSRVLDVGCGIGRLAYPLAHYLGPKGSYEGFDVVDSLIQWTRQAISSQRPNFKFTRVDLYNKHYNPGGRVRPGRFRFPYQDEDFDLVYLVSVFTHMLAKDVRGYLDEIARVLRPGARCLITCFLMNEESEALIAAGKSSQKLVHPLRKCYTTDVKVPELAIGYREELLLGWMAERGLQVQTKEYGSWCGRPSFTSYQDLLVCQKVAPRRVPWFSLFRRAGAALLKRSAAVTDR